MAVLEISITPVGTSNSSFSEYVTQACKILEQKGMDYMVTPTATVVEGEVNALLSMVKEMHSAPFRAGANRVITSITIDERKDKNDSMDQKVDSVVNKLQ